jgi:hypothetical protein
VLAVLTEVAVVAEFETLLAVEIVASFVSAIEPAGIVEAIEILADPSKEVAVPVISPEIAIVLAVARVVAVLALPVKDPVIAPVTPKVPATVVFPVEAATVNLFVATAKSPLQLSVVEDTAPLKTPEAAENTPNTAVAPVPESTVNLLVLTEKLPATVVTPVVPLTVNLLLPTAPTSKLPVLLKVPVTVAPTVPKARAELLLTPS